MQLLDGLVDLRLGIVRRAGRALSLTPTELALLAHLADREGEVVSKDSLLSEVWGYRPGLTTRAVDMTVFKLRRKIEPDPERPIHLVSVRGRGLALRAPVPRLARGSEPGLPSEFDAFVGREAELAVLREAVRGPGLATLVGIGGVGKTRLATHEAHLQAAAGRPVAFCSAGNARTRDELLVAVAASLDVQAGAGIEQLGHALGAREDLLIVLDDLERLVEDLDPLDTWRQQAPRVTFLGTSRRALGRRGERVVQLAPLSRAAAVELLVVRAARHGHEVSGDPALGPLAAQLDDLPLALEFAAARFGLFPPPDVLSRLGHRLDFLRAPHPTRPPHVSLRAMLDWSWELLDVAERRALAELSVFRDGFTLRAAEQILTPSAEGETALDRVDTLFAHSWIQRQPSHPRRLRLLELVQAYADERLSELGSDVRESVERAHGAFFAALGARTALQQLRGPSGPEVLAALVPELGNLQRATLGAVSRGQGDLAVDACIAAVTVLIGVGSDIASVALLERVLALDLSAAERARALAQLGMLLIPSRLEPAQAHFVEALALAEPVGDAAVVSNALRGLGIVRVLQRRVDEAIALFERGMAGDPSGRLLHQRQLAGALEVRGRRDEALKIAAELHTALRCDGNPLDLALLDGWRGSIHAKRGELELAYQLLTGALAGVGTLHPRNAGWCQAELGRVQHLRGAFDDAIGLQREAARGYAARGQTVAHGYVLVLLGETLADQGAFAAALQAADQALVALPTRHAEFLVGRIRVVQGRAQIALGRPQEAIATLAEGSREFLGSDYPEFAVLCSCALTEAFRALGDEARAQAALVEVEGAAAQSGLEAMLALAVRRVRSPG